MIKIAMAGCGYWGSNLIRNFFSLSGCELRTICDVDSERLSRLKSLYPSIETTKDFNKVTEDPNIDAVVIATPVRFHFKMAKASHKAGKHTFVEKPMASAVAECEELVEIAEDKNLTLMIGHTFVYSAPVRRMKEIIGSGYLGQIQYISSQRLSFGLFQKDINVVWDLAPHDISIILYIMKEPPVFVNCQGKPYVNSNIKDVTNVILTFAGGGLAITRSNWLEPNKVRKITIVGNKKCLFTMILNQLKK